MIVEHEHAGRRYRLTNEGLLVGDKVFPVSSGEIRDGVYFHDEFDFSKACSGFPSEPHTIQTLHHSDYKPYQVKTDYGYGPVESYFKIIRVQTRA